MLEEFEGNEKLGTEQVVTTIVQNVFEVPPTRIESIHGKGRNNLVFKIFVNGNVHILRIMESAGQKEIYDKERWCSEAIQGSSVKTPRILQTGTSDAWSYSFQEYVEGSDGIDVEEKIEETWFNLGQYAKSFHQIPADEIAIDYKSKIEDLFENDFFCSRGMFSSELSNKIKRRLEETYFWKFVPTLTHRNLSPRNVILDENGDAWIIDWETAAGDNAFIADLAEIYTWKSGKKNIDAFLKGYGFSFKDIGPIMRDIQTLILLRRVDVIKRMFPEDQDWPDNTYINDTISELDAVGDFGEDVLFTRNL